MLLLALCVLLLAGCSKPVEAAAPQEPVRVEPLVVVVGTPPELQPDEVLEQRGIRGPRDRALAPRSAEGVLLVEPEGQPPALRVAIGRGLVTTQLPDLPWNALRLHCRTGPGSVVLEARRGERVIASSRPLRVKGPKRSTTVSLGLPASGPRPDRVIVRAVGDVGSVDVLGLDLVREDPLARLPRPGVPDWIRAGGEERRGMVLSSSAPLRCTFEALEGSRLHTGFAVPEDLEDKRFTLEAKVWPARGAPIETRFEHVPNPDGTRRWTSVVLELPEAVQGQTLSATFRALPSRLGRHVALVLEQPRVVVPVVRSGVLLVTVDGLTAETVLEPGYAALTENAAREGRVRAVRAAGLGTRAGLASILTGRPPEQNGVRTGRERLSREAPTLATLLSTQGYRTVAVIEGESLGRASGLLRGFDEVHLAPLGTPVDVLGASALRSLAEHQGGPVFLWLHTGHPLPPYLPTERSAKLFPTGRGAVEQLSPRNRAPWARDVEDARILRNRHRAEYSEVDTEVTRLIQHPVLRGCAWAVVGVRGQNQGEHDLWWEARTPSPAVFRTAAMAGGAKADLVLQALGDDASDVGRALLAGSNLLPEAYSDIPPGSGVVLSEDGRRAALSLADGVAILALQDLPDQPGAPALPRHGFRWRGSARSQEALREARKQLVEGLVSMGVRKLDGCACEPCRAAQ